MAAFVGRRPPGDLDRTFVELARAKMGRAVRAARGAPPDLGLLEDELGLIGSAWPHAASAEDAEVFAELWEQADEALLQAAIAEASRAPAPQLAAPPVGAWSTAQEALRAAAARALEVGCRVPWQLEDSYEEPAAAPRRPLQPTPCRSGVRQPAQQPPRREEPSPEEPRRPTGGGFRNASELHRPGAAPRVRGTERGPAPEDGRTASFDEVSRSVLDRSGASGKAGAATAGLSATAAAAQRKRKAEGEAGREWSEDWLRIADAEQLQRIVPALEATIHRSTGDSVVRSDIAGLRFVKDQIEELLILPRLHPHLFASALTRPARGLLLFGPPGTGKTLLARWIASECGATFFNINASSVLSKWIGEAEKTVKALFQLASERQPSVIFVDEVDSLLSQRRDADNESSRRVKNEFLTSLEGADTDAAEKVLLVGATNMPWELDQAALRRLPKRLYVPLPGQAARLSLLRRQLAKHDSKTGLHRELTDKDLDLVAERTQGFSGSDMHTLLQEAAMGPVREASAALLGTLGGAGRRRLGRGAAPVATGAVAAEPRNLMMQDFTCALSRVKPSFPAEHGDRHREFNDEHGTCRGAEALQDEDDDDDEADELGS